jgi:Protein of unknwon function (DUF3310)
MSDRQFNTAAVIPVVDMVNHPPHYKQRCVEALEATRGLGFSLGNAVKYVYRAPFKGHLMEDLEKARFYLKDHTEHRNFHTHQPPYHTRLALSMLARNSNGHEKGFFYAVSHGRYDHALKHVEGLIGDAVEQD